MQEPLVSVCVLSYNYGKYIEETIRSLMNQTYKNLEIIVSDNASTDNTKEIVEKLSRIDNRIKFYLNESNV